MREDVLTVEGMSCNHCKMRVEKAVEALSGVDRVDVALEEKTLTVSYDEAKADHNQITEAVQGQGYQVV